MAPLPLELDRLTVKLLRDIGIFADPDPEYVRRLAGMVAEQLELGPHDAVRVAEWFAPQITMLINMMDFAKNKAESAERFIEDLGAIDAYRHPRSACERQTKGESWRLVSDERTT